MVIPNSSTASRQRHSATLLMTCPGALAGYLPVTTVAVSLSTIQRALLGAVFTPMTPPAVASVPHQLAGMAAAGNSAFRRVGGPADLGALLTTRTIHELPGHLAGHGVSPATAYAVAAAHAGGRARQRRCRSVPNRGECSRPLSASLVDGVYARAALTLLAAVPAGLLRSPSPSGSAYADDQRKGRHHAERGLASADPTPLCTP
jgi:hypothetical protein